MARKNRQAMPLPTTQATPPIRFAPEDGEKKTSSKVSKTQARGSCKKGKCATSCFTRWILRFGIFYLIFAALWRCPSQPFSFSYDANHELLVCREMASFQEHVSPALHEFATSAHRFVEPYAGKYIHAVHGAWKKVEPAVHKSFKQAHTVYRSHVNPGARELYKQAHKWSMPHRKAAHAHYKKHLRPHVKKFSKTMNPYVKTYYKDVHPHAVALTRQMQQAYDHSSKYYVDKVHPSIKQHLYHFYLYLRHTLFPVAHSHYFKHAHPHVSRLHKQASKALDDTLRKYGVKERTLTGSITESAKDTYEKVKEAVIPSASAEPDASDEQASSASSENEIDPATGEKVAVLQARLDAELQKTEAKLGEEEAIMLQLVNDETDRVLADIAEIRRYALPLMPERLEKILRVGIDGGISSVFLQTLREFQARSASLTPDTPVSEAWKESARAWLADQMDTLVDVYDDMRTAAGELVHATRANELQMIQSSVVKIRAQSRAAARVFYDVMEEAEFQVTYYEFEGWDTGMKRRARFFRESVMESLANMSLIGDDKLDAMQLLNAEPALLRSAIDDLFKGMEQGLNALADRLLEHPFVLHDRSAYAQLLLDMHEHLDALSATGHDIALSSTLRLRDLIYDVRESLNMTRIPEEGLLHEVALLPPLVPAHPTTEPTQPEREAVQPTSASDEEAVFATILPVDEELVRDHARRDHAAPTWSETEMLVPTSTAPASSSTWETPSMVSSEHVTPVETRIPATETEAEPVMPTPSSSDVHESAPPAATTEAAEDVQATVQSTLPINTDTRSENSTPVLAPTFTPSETMDAVLETTTSSLLAETPSATPLTASLSAFTTTAATEPEPSISSSILDTTQDAPSITIRPSTTMARMPRPVSSSSSTAEAASDVPRHDEL